MDPEEREPLLHLGQRLVAVEHRSGEQRRIERLARGQLLLERRANLALEELAQLVRPQLRGQRRLSSSLSSSLRSSDWPCR
jgi:hypothetical protein